jgi:hypothetical protein
MTQSFAPGDFLVFQLESGFGLLRILASEGSELQTTWHVGVYEELFPDVESAERTLEHPELLHFDKPHLALTQRAFERTPAAKLANVPVTEDELAAYRQWQEAPEGQVFDRSLLLLLGMR